MDRRRFLTGLGVCATLALPLGCGPKDGEPEEGEAPKEPEIPGEGGTPMEDGEKAKSEG